MPSEPRNDWESAVYDLLCEQCEVTRSDAQARVEAQDAQRRDALASAMRGGLAAEQTTKLLL